MSDAALAVKQVTYEWSCNSCGQTGNASFDPEKKGNCMDTVHAIFKEHNPDCTGSIGDLEYIETS